MIEFGKHEITTPTMCRHISKAEIEIALRMSLQSGLNEMQVAEYTGIRPRTMRGLCKRFRETGEIVKKLAVHGRPRLLNLLDATVGAPQYMSHTFIQFLEDLCRLVGTCHFCGLSATSACQGSESARMCIPDVMAYHYENSCKIKI